MHLWQLQLVPATLMAHSTLPRAFDWIPTQYLFTIPASAIREDFGDVKLLNSFHFVTADVPQGIVASLAVVGAFCLRTAANNAANTTVEQPHYTFFAGDTAFARGQPGFDCVLHS